GEHAGTRGAPASHDRARDVRQRDDRPRREVDAVREDDERLAGRDQGEGQRRIRDPERLDRAEAPVVLDEIDQEESEDKGGRDERAAGRDPPHVGSRTTAKDAATTLFCVISSPSSMRAGTPSWKTAT